MGRGGKRLLIPALVLVVLAGAAALVLSAVRDTSAGDRSVLTVYAASSLRSAFPEIDGAPAYNFAGSNQLKTQIERGAPADVFASASEREAQALFAAGRCTRPATFATNVLVVLVPRADPARLRSIRDLARGPRRRLAVGVEGVPIGDHTRALLRRMGLGSILARNTVSQETSVANITAKVALASADAGVAYRTDATVARDRVRAIRIPEWAQPPVRYQICAVRRPGAELARAQAFIRRVTGEGGRRVLRRWDFGLPARG